MVTTWLPGSGYSQVSAYAALLATNVQNCCRPRTPPKDFDGSELMKLDRMAECLLSRKWFNFWYCCDRPLPPPSGLPPTALQFMKSYANYSLDSSSAVNMHPVLVSRLRSGSLPSRIDLLNANKH